MAKVTPELDSLLAQEGSGRVSRSSSYDPETAAARKKEIARRASLVNSYAQTALKRLFPEEWASLVNQARDKVAVEQGSLPGDAVASGE